MEKDIFIVAAKRTAIGNFCGALSPVGAVELGTHALKAALQYSALPASAVDEVIVGNVLSAALGQGPGRQVAIHAGLPETVPAWTLNIICGSGMKVIMDGASHIAAGDAQVVATVGMESMSNAAFTLPGNLRKGRKMGEMTVCDSMIQDALTDAFSQQHMGITAENIASRYQISRERQDQFALASQEKARQAIQAGYFVDEIVPLTIKGRKGDTLVQQDESPRAVTLEQLAALRPAFRKEGTVTAGNASSLNDGAAAVILASAQAVERYQLTPLARIVSYGQAGVDPQIMGMGPVPAIAQALRRADMTLDQMEKLELNEAFAAQSLGVVQELCQQHQVSEALLLSRINVNGGAIALGHPVGMSGMRITVTLMHILQRCRQRYGLASLCIGGGMGTALILERV